MMDISKQGPGCDRFLRAVLAGMGVIVAASGAAGAEEAARQDPRPNIVLIVADDLGYSDLGAFGGEIETPHLDELIGEGAQLLDFHSSPTCSPTRAMLMSGTDNHVAGLGNMAELLHDEQRGQPGYETFLADRVVAFPELLQDAGYNTYISGKWHLGGQPEQLPVNRGFDKSTVLLAGAAGHFDDVGANVRVPVASFREGSEEFTLPEDFFSTDFYTDRIIEYISEDEDDGKPFFAYLALTAPHWPLQAPQPYIDKYRGRYDAGYEAIREARIDRMQQLGIIGADITPWEFSADWPSWQQLSDSQRLREARLMEVYAAMVDNMDENIGRLVAHLKQTGEYDNTIFVFMSDNGAEGQDAEETSPDNADWIAEKFDNSTDNIGTVTSFAGYGPVWAAVGSTPLRMYKGFTYEGGIRVPAFITAPGRVEPGLRDQFATVMDIAPTLLDYAGVTPPEDTYKGRDIMPITGRSMVDMLSGEAEAVHDGDSHVGWELSGRIAIRQGDWKLVWSNAPHGTDDWELFDLSADPGESRDLAKAEPAKRDAMVALWDDYRERNGDIWSPDMAGRMFYSNASRHFELYP
ncbi:arylsulfatase [Paracoccus siganidrum]|nr:arylsulfatase [Paracoccus siganidrum]